MSNLISRQDAIDVLGVFTQADALGHTPKQIVEALPSAQPEIIRCKECKYCEHWYADKGRCFLWHEGGIDVFEDGFCNYAERRTDGVDR